MINQTTLKTKPFDPFVGQTEAASLTVAFAVNPNNEHHEKHIALFLRQCATHKILCKPVRLSPASTEDAVDILGHVALTLMVCLDNNYAAHMLHAKTRLHISAPLLFADLDIPKTVLSPLPPKCVTVTPETAYFASYFCSIVPTLPNVRVITILHDQHDIVLGPLIPEINAWLEERNYEIKKIARNPTIISDDLLAIASSDLVLFMSKSTPDDYARRLVNVCKQHKTLLYSTNPTLLAHGAHFAFTVNQHDVVQESIAIFIRYLTNNVISSTATIRYQLLINSYEVAHNKTLATSLDPFMKLSQTITVIAPTTPEKVSAYLRLEQIPLE